MLDSNWAASKTAQQTDRRGQCQAAVTNAGLRRAGGQQMVPTDASAQCPAALPRSSGAQPGHAGGSLSTPANSSTDLEAKVAAAL